MQIELRDKVVVTRYREEEIEWNVSTFERTSFAASADPFVDINKYLASLTSVKQRQIYNYFVRIKNVLMTANVLFDDIVAMISKNVKELYEVVPYESIGLFMETNNLYKLPPDLKSNYSSTDVPARTYLKNDYKGLVNLSVALKLMLPVWGEYISLTRSETGTKRKELNAVHLISQTQLIYSPDYLFLINYIQGTIEQASISESSIINGMGSDEQIDWNIANIIIRRVCVASNAADEHLAIKIFNFIKNRMSDLDRGSGEIKDKTPERETDDERSIMDGYKLKEYAAPIDVVSISYYVEDPKLLVSRIDPSVPVELIDACIAMRPKLSTFTPTIANIRLAQWVIKEAQSKGLEIISTNFKIEVLIATHCLLLHWGFPSLALMTTAREVTQEEDGMITIGSMQRKQMTAHLDAELNRIYPYKRQNKDAMNWGKAAINRYFSIVAGNSFKSVTAEGYETLYEPFLTPLGYHQPMPDMPLRLAELLIKVNG